MEAQERFYLFLKVIRAAGLLVLGLIALTGAPDTVGADEGCKYALECTDDADDCVERQHENCTSYGECGEMKVFCRPSHEYVDCPNDEFIVMCEEVQPD